MSTSYSASFTSLYDAGGPRNVPSEPTHLIADPGVVIYNAIL